MEDVTFHVQVRTVYQTDLIRQQFGKKFLPR